MSNSSPTHQFREITKKAKLGRAHLRGILKQLQGSSIEFDLSRYEPTLRAIEERGSNLRSLSSIKKSRGCRGTSF